MYEPAKTWSTTLQNQCKFEGLYQTKIKRVNFDGKNTYQLLEMHSNDKQQATASSAEKHSQNSTITVEQAQKIVENYFKSQNYHVSSVTHMPGKDTGAQATIFYSFRVGQSTKEAPNLSFHVYVADNTGKIYDENLSPIN